MLGLYAMLCCEAQEQVRYSLSHRDRCPSAPLFYFNKANQVFEHLFQKSKTNRNDYICRVIVIGWGYAKKRCTSSYVAKYRYEYTRTSGGANSATTFFGRKRYMRCLRSPNNGICLRVGCQKTKKGIFIAKKRYS